MLRDPNKLKKIPANCDDLQQLGHKLNGLYLVKTSRPKQPKKIETVFCNFQSPLAATCNYDLLFKLMGCDQSIETFIFKLLQLNSNLMAPLGYKKT